ncbi:MAG: carboxypeptidase-like regulatory domain-containing protein [Planctomycetota bacterium]|nr:carboxypeptidase-like regulatory domain-containing protein [Planctomycetota bacterium]MDA1213111.1 carboxypeptidase-like regulatory domain-containing protein [Planctomycetota bacterium]
MKRLLRLSKFAMCCSCCAMLLSPTGVFADKGTATKTLSKESSSQTAEATTIRDVALASGGTFNGQLLNAEGLALSGVEVAMYQGTEQVARTVTDTSGYFSVSNLRGGVYQVNAENTQEVYRLWSEEMAPPSAEQDVVIVSNPKVVRGQIGGVDIITATALGAAIAGVTLAAINRSELNDIEDKLDKALASP